MKKTQETQEHSREEQENTRGGVGEEDIEDRSEVIAITLVDGCTGLICC